MTRPALTDARTETTDRPMAAPACEHFYMWHSPAGTSNSRRRRPDLTDVLRPLLGAHADTTANHVLASDWLAAVKAEAGRAALREAAKDLPGFPDILTHGDAARWLRARADQMGTRRSDYVRDGSPEAVAIVRAARNERSGR